MSNKGFTLIELIGSIVILAAIALVAFPAILSTLQNGNDEVDSAMSEALISAAGEYVNDNKDSYKISVSSSLTKYVTVSTLKENGYITTSLYENNCEIQNDKIKVTASAGDTKYTYEYVEVSDSCD